MKNNTFAIPNYEQAPATTEVSVGGVYETTDRRPEVVGALANVLELFPGDSEEPTSAGATSTPEVESGQPAEVAEQDPAAAADYLRGLGQRVVALRTAEQSMPEAA